MRDREKFVDLFLEQNFQLHDFVTVNQLRTLFAKCEDREFFVTVVWEGILEKSPGKYSVKYYVFTPYSLQIVNKRC